MVSPFSNTGRRRQRNSKSPLSPSSSSRSKSRSPGRKRVIAKEPMNVERLASILLQIHVHFCYLVREWTMIVQILQRKAFQMGHQNSLQLKGYF